MNSLDSLTTFFGWCSVISTGVLFLTSATLLLMHGMIAGLHARMFGMTEADVSRAYFQYLAHFKIAVIMFNLVPYIALRMMA